VGIEVYEGRPSKAGRWRWRLRAANGRIVANGGEAFHDRWNAERAVADFLRIVGPLVPAAETDYATEGVPV
jgi:uncharacterized protein YegP (UPF0339 family)